MDLGVALKLGLVILDPEWSGSGQTGVPRALILYMNWKNVKRGRTKIY